MRLRTLAFLAASILAASATALTVRSEPVRAAGADVAQSASSAIPSPNVAQSPATLPYVGVQVVGKPRVAAKHPNVFWDQEDIDHYKEMLRSSRELQIQFEDLKRRMDEVTGQPVSIPEPQKGPDGQWLFPGDYFPRPPGTPNELDSWAIFRGRFARDSETVSNLGTLYVLTGDEKYAKYARDILIGYSNCSRYGPPKGMTKRSNLGLLGQLLDEALMLQVITRGYDLISSSRSVSEEDRIRIHDELLRPLATEMVYPTAPDVLGPGSTFSSQPNNRGAMGAASVLLVGYATDDQELVNAGLYGTRSTLPYSDPVRRMQFPPPKDWTAATADNPSEGLLTVFFAPPGISGGMWVEGSPAYALYALGSLVNAAEAAWRHGLDLYSYDNAIFKHLFDYPIDFAYPDLSLPGENDSHRDSLLDGYAPILYEYGYRRYRDPRYLALINSPKERAYLASLRSSSPDRRSRDKSSRSLIMFRGGAVPPSFLYDLDPNEQSGKIEPVNINYASVGFGISRVPAANGLGIENLILSYGPSASHGHPDKLHLDLFAFDDVLMPSPGINFPYANNTLLPNWYHTTVAHNALTVDLGVQEAHEHNRYKPDVRADQTVYGPAETMGLQRAWTDTAYPGVHMDRAVFLNGWYLADLFSAISDKPHTYDLAWHIRGAPTSDLALTPTPFPDPVPVGYNQLTNVRQSQPTSNSWVMTLALKDHESRLVAAGGDATRAIVGDGGIYVDLTSDAPKNRPEAPTIVQRREGASSTIFGNVLDLSSQAGGYVKSVRQNGGIGAGFATLRIETADGADLCFASYRSGDFATDGIETDALQAFVSSNRSGPRALYLGGGTILKAGAAVLARSEPGLASVETAQDGHVVIANPSPSAATVTVTLKALQGLEAFYLDGESRPKGKAEVEAKGAGSVSLRLEADSRVGFFPPGRP
jgi:hypothetical protein